MNLHPFLAWALICISTATLLQYIYIVVRQCICHSPLFFNQKRIVPLLHAAYMKTLLRLLAQKKNKDGSQARVAVYGGGLHTKWLFALASVEEITDLKVVAIIDDNPRCSIQAWGLSSITPSEFKAADADILLISSDVYSAEIKARIGALDKEGLEIIAPYQEMPPEPIEKDFSYIARAEILATREDEELMLACRRTPRQPESEDEERS